MKRGRRRVVSAWETWLSTPVLVLMTALCALTICAGPTRAEWQTFSHGDGLADIGVFAMIEDSSESLWFGTDYGVSRYDGVSWTTYTAADGLAHNTVWAIIEGSSGNLWFGTLGGGASRYDGVSWTTYTTADGLADNRVLAIIEDSSGNLWFGTLGGGVSRYDGVSWTTYTTADGLADNDVYAIAGDSSGDLWFGTVDGGVSRYDGVSWTTYTTADGLAGNAVYSVIKDSSENLWFGTSEGVSRYDGVSWTTYTAADGLADNAVYAIAEDRSGSLWFGTCGGGVSRYDGVSWTTYTTADGLAHDLVNAIIGDSSGNLWFGTHRGGVSRYDGVDWTTYTTDDGLAGDRVGAILEDSSGSVWFGTHDGVSRYDGVSWTTYTTADGLADNHVTAIGEDGSGNLWFGTYDGLSRYDGVSWTTYTTADGLAGNAVYSVIEDSSENLWFGTFEGVSRYDGVSWTTYTTEDGLAGNIVRAMIEDSSGDLWFVTHGSGVSRYDGASWTTYTTADGLADNEVYAIVEDTAGDLWFGTWDGVSCYDGLDWTTYRKTDGLAGDDVHAIIEDSLGHLWFGTSWGVSCYDGLDWTTYTIADGLAANSVWAIIEDSSGRLWFGSSNGLSAHEPDRVAPQTVIWPKPPPLTASRTQTIGFTVAYGESRGIRFSDSFDGSLWSEWSELTPTGLWIGSDLPDGRYVFKVRARDRVGNVDSTPATLAFEVDATSPAPVVSYPVFGEAVRDSVTIQGTAADLRFDDYLIDVHPVGSAPWEVLAGSNSPVTEGVLGAWNTTLTPDGEYELRLSVSDTLGLTGTALVRVEVDNEAPWAWETSPVAVSASTGGDVYTTNREAHLYFPPRALDRDALVLAVPADESSVPDTLAGGAELVLAGYDIFWEGAELTKQATLRMALTDDEAERDLRSVLALYVLAEGQEWQRLGGTVESDGASISAAIELEGTYAVFSDSGGPAPGGGLSALSFTPRVFSPSGSFANTEVAISFTLGRSGPVTVKVYNRAGRLVDELVSRFQMNAGANVVRWDGRDGDGAEVPDGLYLVAIEALGETQVRTLAVVR